MFKVKKESNVPSCIYIDCTETYFSGINTGIQRVVSNIVVRAKYLAKQFGVPCVPVIAYDDGYIPLYKISAVRLTD